MPKAKKDFKNIAFVASEHQDAQDAAKRLIMRYGNAAPENADAIIALGGDGLMLQTLHAHMDNHIPIRFRLHRSIWKPSRRSYRGQPAAGTRDPSSPPP